MYIVPSLYSSQVAFFPQEPESIRSAAFWDVLAVVELDVLLDAAVLAALLDAVLDTELLETLTLLAATGSWLFPAPWSRSRSELKCRGSGIFALRPSRPPARDTGWPPRA